MATYPVSMNEGEQRDRYPDPEEGTNPIGRPRALGQPAAATFAAAAMIVALPPKHAPSASAHQ